MAIIRDSNSTAARGAIVLDLGDLAAQGQRIRDLAAEEAAQIIRKAKEERQRLIATASEEGHAAGHAKGHAEGLEAGRVEGLAQATEKVVADGATLISTLSNALDEFIARRDDLLVKAREDVLRLALLFARRIVDRVIEVDADVASRQLERILPLVLRPSRLTIRVNPDDAASLTAMLPDLAQRFECARDGQVVADPSLKRGSCVLSSAGGAVIDASIATQVADLAFALLPDGGVSDLKEAA
jgi:flagellar assembly protein FliH